MILHKDLIRMIIRFINRVILEIKRC